MVPSSALAPMGANSAGVRQMSFLTLPDYDIFGR